MGSPAYAIMVSSSGTIESVVALLLVLGMFWGFYSLIEASRRGEL